MANPPSEEEEEVPFDLPVRVPPANSTDHPPTTVNPGARNQEMLDLILHATHCRVERCQHPNCRKVKGLYFHGIQCTTHAHGGCILCNKMWYLLQFHARACKESQCYVPRCRDLKEHLSWLRQESDSQRAAEQHNSSG